MPYSQEISGRLKIANAPHLVDGLNPGQFDVIVAEVKTGKQNKPNRVWCKGESNSAIEYIVRFIGLHGEDRIANVAESLAKCYRFEDERFRYRYILFSETLNTHYENRGVTYILLEEAISFIVNVRGQCWLDSGIGVASAHHQWDDLMVEIFQFANNTDMDERERTSKIWRLLGTKDV